MAHRDDGVCSILLSHKKLTNPARHKIKWKPKTLAERAALGEAEIPALDRDDTGMVPGLDDGLGAARRQ
jgi:hypothetical protein